MTDRPPADATPFKTPKMQQIGKVETREERERHVRPGGTGMRLVAVREVARWVCDGVAAAWKALLRSGAK